MRTHQAQRKVDGIALDSGSKGILCSGIKLPKEKERDSGRV